MSGYVKITPSGPVILSGTSAVAFIKGQVGASGAAGDTLLRGITILKNASAVTATIAGCADSTGAAANIVLTGSTADDRYFPLNWINTVGALTITPSVTLKVVAEVYPSGKV